MACCSKVGGCSLWGRVSTPGRPTRSAAASNRDFLGRVLGSRAFPSAERSRVAEGRRRRRGGLRAVVRARPPGGRRRRGGGDRRGARRDGVAVARGGRAV